MNRSAVVLSAALVVASLAVLTARQGAQEVLTNDTVVAMVQARLGTAIVVAKIKTSTTTFDLSTASLIALKSKGIPDEVIQAMLEASASAVPPPAARYSSSDANGWPGSSRFGSISGPRARRPVRRRPQR